MNGLPGHDPPARSAAARVPAARRRGVEAARATRSACSSAELDRIVESLRETNPMLGHRGCRLGITYPEITEMQARAIFEAAVRATPSRHRRAARRSWCRSSRPRASSSTSARSSRTSRDRCSARWASTCRYLIGTMIELPRAALTADEIASDGGVLLVRHERPHADDVRPEPRRRRPVPPVLRRAGIFPDDPFQVLDATRRGQADPDGGRGRSPRRAPGSRSGICGEHGGEPRVVTFCHQLGLDYVSCSPFRVPIARLAAAQAALASPPSPGNSHSAAAISHQPSAIS